MTLRFAEHVLAGVPVLLAARDEARLPLPTVLWFHGLGAGKDAHRAELARVARCGWLAVGVDAVDHGARRHPELDARIALPREGTLAAMLAMADATVDEIPALVRALADEGMTDPARVAVVGVSMGGYLAYRAAARVPGLAAVVALLGSPEWPGDDSPHRHPASVHDVPLLSVTAERDASVPPDVARRFHAALALDHPHPDRCRYVELPGAEHLMDAEAWQALIDETIRWLDRWLAPAP